MKTGTLNCARLGSRDVVKPRRLRGRPGFTRQPRTPNVHISGPWRFKHHQNSTKGPPERDKHSENGGGRRKKKCEFGPSHPLRPTLRGPTLQSPTLRCPHPSGPHPFGPHPSGPHFFKVWASHPSGPPPFRAPLFVVPKFNIQKLAEVEIGRSRNLPKSKKKLAEVEIGRSRSRSPHLPPESLFLGLHCVEEYAVPSTALYKLAMCVSLMSTSTLPRTGRSSPGDVTPGRRATTGSPLTTSRHGFPPPPLPHLLLGYLAQWLLPPTAVSLPPSVGALAARRSGSCRPEQLLLPPDV